VAELSDEPQGVVLPPALPNGFGENWFSEGIMIITTAIVFQLNFFRRCIAYNNCSIVFYFISVNIFLFLSR
jgi:hypothetical protein